MAVSGVRDVVSRESDSRGVLARTECRRCRVYDTVKRVLSRVEVRERSLYDESGSIMAMLLELTC